MTELQAEPLRHPALAEIQLLEVLKALADATRLDMVTKLADAEPRELSCSDFGCATKQLTSHHLRTLREAGVTATREDGRNRYTRLRREVLDTLFPGLLDGVLASRNVRRSAL